MLAVNLGQGNDINVFNHFCQLVVRHGLGDQLELLAGLLRLDNGQLFDLDGGNFYQTVAHALPQLETDFVVHILIAVVITIAVTAAVVVGVGIFPVFIFFVAQLIVVIAAVATAR